MWPTVGMLLLQHVKQCRQADCVTDEEADIAGVNEVAEGWRMMFEQQQR